MEQYFGGLFWIVMKERDVFSFSYLKCLSDKETLHPLSTEVFWCTSFPPHKPESVSVPSSMRRWENAQRNRRVRWDDTGKASSILITGKGQRTLHRSSVKGKCQISVISKVIRYYKVFLKDNFLLVQIFIMKRFYWKKKKKKFVLYKPYL